MGGFMEKFITLIHLDLFNNAVAVVQNQYNMIN